MTAPLLSRHAPPHTLPHLPVLPEMALARARVHEICGAARRTAAIWAAGAMLRAQAGPVLWIAPAWAADRLNPDGMVPWADPSRFLFAAPKRPEDALWCMEEALRSGAVALVVADLIDPPGLVAVRRMHLAAGGAATLPLGLILTPGAGGAPGVESRWHLAPEHGAGHTGWRLERRRARTLPPKAWVVAETPEGLHAGPPAQDRAPV